MCMPGDERSGRGVMLMLDGRWPMCPVSGGPEFGVRSPESRVRTASSGGLWPAPPRHAAVRVWVPCVVMCGHVWPKTRRIWPFPAGFADGHGRRWQALASPVDAMDGWVGEWKDRRRSPPIALRDGFDVLFEIVSV
jgi:hypothetical protein